ncbi:GDP-mannose 4,6-dehydratase [Candidatus Sumerlaeota bacterium]|nr:GDP-mannose 4,6-dehydratase [Candidatus Sumerlaeota bacterium]
MRNMKVSALVTGFDGFVGPYLAQRLLSMGRKVFGTIYSGKKWNPPVSEFLAEKIIEETETLPIDLEDYGKVRELIETVQPREVYHLAGISHVPTSWANPRSTFSINVMGTVNLLEAIRELGNKTRILIVSSAEVYGTPRKGELPTKETCPLRPENPYAASKAAIDLLAGQWSDYPGIHIVRVRPFSHTGPGQSADFACPAFARQAAAIELGLTPPAIRVGNLSVKRDFSDVRDVVKAYFLALQKGANGEAYNVCSGKSLRLSRILNILTSFCDKKISVEIDPDRFRQTDVPETRGSHAKLSRMTRWRPQIPLRNTLHDLYRYYYDLLKNGSSISSTRTKR